MKLGKKYGYFQTDLESTAFNSKQSHPALFIETGFNLERAQIKLNFFRLKMQAAMCVRLVLAQANPPPHTGSPPFLFCVTPPSSSAQ